MVNGGLVHCKTIVSSYLDSRLLTGAQQQATVLAVYPALFVFRFAFFFGGGERGFFGFD